MTEDDNKASLAARARALDPAHLAAHLASSGWTAVSDTSWLPPGNGPKVALPPNTAAPEQVRAAATSAASATGQDLDSLVSAVERVPHDAFVFAPARFNAGKLPLMARTPALAEALHDLVLGAARAGASLYGRGASEALDLAKDLMLAPVPGESEAIALLAKSPLEADAPRLGPPLAEALQDIAAAAGGMPNEFVLRTAARRLQHCADVYEGGLAVIIRPTVLRIPREPGRALHLPPQPE